MPAAPTRPGDAPGPARRLRALRGATTVDRDDAAPLLAATAELLRAMLDRNGLHVAEVVSIIVTTTRDLSSADPARATRDLGWPLVPVLSMSEIGVPTGLPRCIRVLMHVDVPRAHSAPRPVYLRDATALRPDLAARA